MADRFWEFTPDTLRERHIERARFLALLLSADGSRTLVAMDAAADELVRVPGVLTNPMASPLALSWDGTRLLAITGPDNQPTRDLVLFSLATGEQRFNVRVDGLVDSAALSPDGRSMATVSIKDEGDVGVSVTDIDTGRQQRLWSATGWRSVAAGVSWSPDGRLLAATYITEDDVTSTAVLDVADGTVVAHYDGLHTLGSPNGSWTRERELLLVEEFPEEEVPPALLEDLTTGATQRIYPVPGHSGGCFAVVGGRLVRRRPDGLYNCELDGTDPRPVLALAPGFSISFFDVSAEF